MSTVASAAAKSKLPCNLSIRSHRLTDKFYGDSINADFLLLLLSSVFFGGMLGICV